MSLEPLPSQRLLLSLQLPSQRLILSLQPPPQRLPPEPTTNTSETIPESSNIFKTTATTETTSEPSNVFEPIAVLETVSELSNTSGTTALDITITFRTAVLGTTTSEAIMKKCISQILEIRQSINAYLKSITTNYTVRVYIRKNSEQYD